MYHGGIKDNLHFFMIFIELNSASRERRKREQLNE